MTLIELLVTIVVAAIFFAAMVPVFVLAQKTGRGDEARVVAVNLAQSKMERIRDLPYQLVNQGFLTGRSTEARNAGIDTQWTSADGKPYQITYTVTKVVRTKDASQAWVFTEYPTPNGLDVSDGTESYKMVTVEVVWQGPPLPSRRTVLRTAIYRRFAGSEITRMTVSPLSTLPSGREGIYAPNGPVWMTVNVSPYDWDDTLFVTFSVEGPSGDIVFEQQVTVTHGAPPPIVTCQWQWADRPSDGMYKFTAVATNQNGEEGNEWSLWYPLDTGPPPAPSSLPAIRGRVTAIVQWNRPNADDLIGYAVDRRPLPGGPSADTARPWLDIPIWTLAPMTGSTYFPAVLIDRSITADSRYEYVARGRDLQYAGADSSPMTVDPVTDPSLRADVTAPATPSQPGLTPYGQAVKVTWTAPRAAADISYYCIYRDEEWDYPLACVPASASIFSITDNRAGWDSTHSYSVGAMDRALNESRSPLSPITIPPAPIGQSFGLTVRVHGYSAQVSVESLADYLSYPLNGNGASQNQQYVAFLNANQRRTFTNLPYGMYRVRVRFDGPANVPAERRLFVQDIELYGNLTLPDFTAPTS